MNKFKYQIKLDDRNFILVSFENDYFPFVEKEDQDRYLLLSFRHIGANGHIYKNMEDDERDLIHFKLKHLGTIIKGLIKLQGLLNLE